MQPQIPNQRPVTAAGQAATNRGLAGFSPSKGVYPKASPNQSESDEGSMAAYGKSIGARPAAPAKPAKAAAPKPVLRGASGRAPVKVDIKGNIVNQGGRPRASRGTSTGSMIIRNGRK